jgi:hypothetical protein
VSLLLYEDVRYNASSYDSMLAVRLGFVNMFCQLMSNWFESKRKYHVPFITRDIFYCMLRHNLFTFIPNQSHSIGIASDLDLYVGLVYHSSFASRLTVLKLNEAISCSSEYINCILICCQLIVSKTIVVGWQRVGKFLWEIPPSEQFCSPKIQHLTQWNFTLTTSVH